MTFFSELLSTYAGPIAATAMVLALFAIAYAQLGLRRAAQLQMDMQQQLQQQISEHIKQLQLVSSGSLGMGQRMMVLENKMRCLKTQQDDIRQNDLEFSYTQAQKLLEQGVDEATVVTNSGLSASEIALMKLLQQQQHASNSVSSQAPSQKNQSSNTQNHRNQSHNAQKTAASTLSASVRAGYFAEA